MPNAKAETSRTLATSTSAIERSGQSPALRPGATVFIDGMPDDFDTYLKAALKKKEVPLVIVASREEADFEIKGVSDSQKAGAAKKIMLGSWHSDEQASISVSSIRTGDIVYAYSANKKNSAHGKQTTAEACAKHLKETIEKGK